MERNDNRLVRHLALATALGLAGFAAATDREFSGETSAKDLATLRLDAHVGEVEIVATDGDKIRWTLRLEPDANDGWFGSRKDAQAAVDGAKVRAAAAGSAWELELELPRGADFDDVEEHWRIEVPARLGVVVDANVGEVHISGVAGGVEAVLNVGELRIDVPKGDVRARLNVGDVSITSRTASSGRVELEANVGETDLRIDGKRVESGRMLAIGGSVESRGTGEDDIEASVNVGEVSVRVER